MFARKLTGIMACDPKGVIGKDGQLPWHYPEDLEHFRQTTFENVMIMGYKTYLSLPEEILQDRFNIVFTHEPDKKPGADLIFTYSLTDFLNLKNLPDNKQYYVIGGAEIIGLFLSENLIDEFLLTRIKKTYSGDTFFPLELLKNYPYSIIKETKDFSICKYTDLKSNMDHKNN